MNLEHYTEGVAGRFVFLIGAAFWWPPRFQRDLFAADVEPDCDVANLWRLLRLGQPFLLRVVHPLLPQSGSLTPGSMAHRLHWFRFDNLQRRGL